MSPTNRHFSCEDSPMRRIRRIHFVGIGGVGMSGIAEVLLNEGYEISGSDMSQNTTTEHLQALGATVYTEHHASNVQDKDVVVISSAITDDNPEVVAATELRMPVISRAEMLAELMRFRIGVAIAGTHGKTTTTSLVSTLLAEGGLDPTYVIGGRLNSAGSNAKLGTGKYLVAEADESDASFLLLKPTYAVVTNIDLDHMATYQGSFTELRKTFSDFLHHLPFYGLAVLCIDDDNVRNLLPEIKRPVTTYGFSDDADIRASNYEQRGLHSHFELHIPGEDKPLALQLNLPGKHNVLNALAAVTIAKEVGVSNDAIKNCLAKFEGIGRRFQVHEGVTINNGKVTLVDDYGHHPTEVMATLEALRNVWPKRRLVLVFQPHRYSRTRDLFEDFVDVLSQSDVLLLMDVYAAGEAVIPGADGRTLCRAIRQRGQQEPVFIENKESFISVAPNILNDNDVVLMQGAGNIGQIAQHVKNQGLESDGDELAG